MVGKPTCLTHAWYIRTWQPSVKADCSPYDCDRDEQWTEGPCYQAQLVESVPSRANDDTVFRAIVGEFIAPHTWVHLHGYDVGCPIGGQVESCCQIALGWHVTVQIKAVPFKAPELFESRNCASIGC